MCRLWRHSVEGERQGLRGTLGCTIVGVEFKRRPAGRPSATQSPNSDVWARVRGELVRAVNKHCPSDLTSLREDLVQTALLKVVERGTGRSWEEEHSRASYLRKVAFTLVIDELRRKRRQDAQRVALAASPPAEAEPLDVGFAIRQCLELLPESRRVTVTLYLQGSRSSETARAMSWKVKRVENLLYRGLEELRQCLSSKGVES